MSIAKVQVGPAVNARRPGPRVAFVVGFSVPVLLLGLMLFFHPAPIAYAGVLIIGAIVLSSFRSGEGASRERFVRAYGSTHVGRVRSNNEDALLIADLSGAKAVVNSVECEIGAEGVLFAVSDGMGGEQAGEVASAMGLEALRDHLAGSFATDDQSTRLASAIAHANHVVIEAGKKSEHEGMGATLAVALLSGANVYVASVGDARVYLLRGDHFQQLTHDQSFVQLLIDAGTITADEAREQPNRNVILQALGKNESLDLRISSFAAQRGDRLMLCSDGLSGFIPAEEIRVLLHQESPKMACECAVDRANAAGGEDNVTVIVALLDGEGYAPASNEKLVLQQKRLQGGAMSVDR